MKATKVISITLPESMIASATEWAAQENRSVSELVEQALRQYEWRRWLEETRPYAEERAVAAGILTEEDVDRAIHESRRERRDADGRADRVRQAS